VVTLTEIFRQAQESMIVVNAHKVNQGQFPVLKGVDKPEETDFRFIQEEDPEKILQNILDLCSERIPVNTGFIRSKRSRFWHPCTREQLVSPISTSNYRRD